MEKVIKIFGILLAIVCTVWFVSVVVNSFDNPCDLYQYASIQNVPVSCIKYLTK